jgi:hypothetical protein
MARNNNTYAKRQRDLQKKQKSEDKRARRLKRKEGVKSGEDSGAEDSNAEDSGGEGSSAEVSSDGNRVSSEA